MQNSILSLHRHIQFCLTWIKQQLSFVSCKKTALYLWINFLDLFTYFSRCTKHVCITQTSKLKLFWWQVTNSVLPASVFKNKSVFLCFFFIVVFFCCGKVFLSAFFSFKMCFIFLNHAGKSQVLQIFIAISEFLGNSFINFPQNLVLLLRGQ